MGMLMSSMGKGWPPTPLLGFDIGTLHQQFLDRKIESFDEFHSAILDLFITINSALPGKHYDVPPTKELETCFKDWSQAVDEKSKRKVIIEFMKKKITISKLDNSTLMTGILTPPAAMATKRAGENVAQIKALKAIPDVIFVPGFTIVALVCAKLTRRMFQGGFANPFKKIEAQEVVHGKREPDRPDEGADRTGPIKVLKVEPQAVKPKEKLYWWAGPTEVRKVTADS